MSTKLANEDITAAKKAIDDYVTHCIDIFGKMDSEVSGLRGTDFIGDGSNGYQEFYNALKTNLFNNILSGDSALMPALKKCLDSIGEALMDNADVKIGDSNKNAMSNNTNTGGN